GRRLAHRGLDLQDLDLFDWKCRDRARRHAGAETDDRGALAALRPEQHRNISGHELAQRVAVRAVDLSVRAKVLVFASRALMDTDGGRQSLLIIENVVSAHLLGAERIGVQALIAFAVERNTAGHDAPVPD